MRNLYKHVEYLMVTIGDRHLWKDFSLDKKVHYIESVFENYGYPVQRANNCVISPYIRLFFNESLILELTDKLWNLLQIGVGGYVIVRSTEKIAESKLGSK